MRVLIKRVVLGVAVCAIPVGFSCAHAQQKNDSVCAEEIERCAREIKERAQSASVRIRQDSTPDAPFVPDMLLPGVPYSMFLRDSSNALSSSRDSWEGTRYCIRIYSYDGYGPSQGSMIDGIVGFSVVPVLGFDAPEPDQQTKPVTPGPATKPVAPPPVAPPTAAPEKPKPSSPPSLDELLGLTPSAAEAKPGDTSKSVDSKPADDASNVELDRLLSAAEMGDVFKQAVTLMNDAAKRLNEKQDSSVQTQRIQEDVVRKLDQLLASLDQQQQQQQQPQPQQQQDKPQNQPQSKQQQERQQGEDQGDGTDPQEGERPTLKQGALGPQVESARAAWGALPARVREMLMQGSGDRFSSRYKQMTEEYYKRLAEEAGR